MEIELNIIERLKLLEILPNEGNRLNRKIVRKLNETMSLSEAELKLIPVRYEFMCLHQNIDEHGSLISLCQNKGYFSERPKCAEHNVPMQATGELQILHSPMLYSHKKTIHLGDESLKIIKDCLKVLNDLGKINDSNESLYDKFYPPEEKEGE